MKTNTWAECKEAANLIKNLHPFTCIRAKIHDNSIQACIRASDDGWNIQFRELVDGKWQWCSLPVHPGIIKEIILPGENA
jgi:hypothetical protein